MLSIDLAKFSGGRENRARHVFIWVYVCVAREKEEASACFYNAAGMCVNLLGRRLGSSTSPLAALPSFRYMPVFRFAAAAAAVCNVEEKVALLYALVVVAPMIQDFLGRWSVIPVLAVAACLWNKWRARQLEGKLEQCKLEEVSPARQPWRQAYGRRPDVPARVPLVLCTHQRAHAFPSQCSWVQYTDRALCKPHPLRWSSPLF